jgi:hypothetical protein
MSGRAVQLAELAEALVTYWESVTTPINATDVAHKLSCQLRAAEERITQLEGDLRDYRERAERAGIG